MVKFRIVWLVKADVNFDANLPRRLPLLNAVANADFAVHDDFGVDAAPPRHFALVGHHPFSRRAAETTGELGAAGMRQRRDLPSPPRPVAGVFQAAGSSCEMSRSTKSWSPASAQRDRSPASRMNQPAIHQGNLRIGLSRCAAASRRRPSPAAAVKVGAGQFLALVRAAGRRTIISTRAACPGASAPSAVQRASSSSKVIVAAISRIPASASNPSSDYTRNRAKCLVPSIRQKSALVIVPQSDRAGASG